MKSLFRGIGWRIFLSFSTLLIVLVVLGSFLGLKFAQKMATNSSANELRVLTVTLSGQIEKYLKKIETDLKSLGSSGGILDLEMRKEHISKERLENFLRNKKNQSVTFEDLSVFDVSGICVAATDKSWIGLSAQRETFFINGLKRYGFAEILESKNHEKILLVSTPINEGMDPQGVLVGQIKLSALYDLIGQKLGVKGTQAFLLDSKLRFITTESNTTESNRERSFLSSPLTQHLRDEFWVGEYLNSSDKEVLGTISKLQGRQWYLVLEKDFSQVDSELNEIKNVLFTSTVILLIAFILMTILIAHSITRPLQALVSGVQKIASGDFSQPFSVPTGLDEISFLTQEFENMRARISSSQGKLIEQLADSEQRRIINERLAAIGTLASSLAHEIRNPLNALSLLLAQQERANKADESKVKAYDLMRMEVGRLDRLVTDILDYSKPLQLKLEKTDLKILFDNLLSFYKPTFEAKKIKLVYEPTSEPALVKADESKLQQAFVNLFQNAIEAMDEKSGEIKISFKNQSDFIEIDLEDSGVGIKDGMESRFFDLFFTTKEKGTGLGLSTVRKITDAHGGKITLERAAVKGTLVRVSIPVYSQN